MSRKQIWGRFSNLWNSNEIQWNCLIWLTWSRILMYLRNTVGKRHKNSFSATEIYGFETALPFAVHRSRRWLKWRSKVNVFKIRAIKGDGNPTRLLPHAKMLLVPIKFFVCWADYALEGAPFSLSKCYFTRMFHTERSWDTLIYCGY